MRATPIVPASMLAPPTGGLMGSACIINVGDGTLYPYDATALDDFSRMPLWTPATDMAHPSLADVNPKTSELLDVGGYRQSNRDVPKGASPADSVSAVLMQNHLLNTYVLDIETNSATDWIVTMPTKPFYVPVAPHSVGAATPPFESTFAEGGAPDYCFIANDYVNGALPAASGLVLSNYGATLPHKGSLRIE